MRTFLAILSVFFTNAGLSVLHSSFCSILFVQVLHIVSFIHISIVLVIWHVDIRKIPVSALLPSPL
jgi:hypothetical protein